MNINSNTDLFCIIGYPIKHSLSPVLHTTLAQHYNLNFVYLAFEINPEDFKNIKKLILMLKIKGLNVTIPYKEKIIKYLDKIDNLAKKIKAVNTIVNKNGKLLGYNTDVYGFIKSLNRRNLKNKKVLVLGCGGVGKAIICGLEKLKVNKIFIYDVNYKKMLSINKNFPNITMCIKYEQIKNLMNEISMIVNATPLGMKDNDPVPINFKWLNKNHIVYDVIYNRPTQLINYAKKIGCDYIDGKDMFIYQAQQSFFLWTGIKPDFSLMYKILNKNLI